MYQLNELKIKKILVLLPALVHTLFPLTRDESFLSNWLTSYSNSRATIKQMAMLFDAEHSSDSNDRDDIGFLVVFRVDHPIEREDIIPNSLSITSVTADATMVRRKWMTGELLISVWQISLLPARKKLNRHVRSIENFIICEAELFHWGRKCKNSLSCTAHDISESRG